MNSKVFLVARILLGLFVLVFGLNKFFGFIPFGEMPELAGNYFAGIGPTHLLKIVGIIEILAGLAFILNKYGALMAVILMSVSVNAVLFHATLAPADIMGALILLVLNIAVLMGYKDRYKELLRA
ncbi:DoxX family protein [Flagellimonas hymeniacidonis]|uniref:DoxX family protein n=1 Tax=Flagellimonas hymeniacidonis TaxID=2603628 RepID=A0A5C8V0C8_9FLAO|nr:DoxX family membrane protein [Flagellimonas hymeniacidonis]TXN34766.1 DoxX family protein [Flagellimonas hymeniacidonis]